MVKHWREHDGVIHAEGANGDDRTLCGVILEGIEGEHPMTETSTSINCRDCIGTITFCRKIRSGEFISTARGAR
jgi:hypothetical protein